MRRISGVKKVGHAGTLDPQAEGLLIVLVGKDYTKKSDSFLKLDKTYKFTIKLGEVSDTGDSEGEITNISNKKPTRNTVLSVIQAFTGKIDQVPPQYSAIKVNGVRSYKSARRGEKVLIEPRKVTINSLKILDYNYPYATLEADVSSGTYIRSLAEDIGNLLKTGAFCTQIIRTRIGDYSLKDSLTLD